MATTAQFKTWRFGYEYDFLYKPRGFLGVILDVKVTDVNVGLNSPIGDEFAKALAPIPTIGAVGRVYPAKNLALNGEFGYFRVPESVVGRLQGPLRRLGRQRDLQRQQELRRPGRLPERSTSSTRCATIPAR